MKPYKILLHEETIKKIEAYRAKLNGRRQAGHYLQQQLKGERPAQLSVTALLERLIRTKQPQIFAESEVAGDGSDWQQAELSILGDVTIAVPVTVYDNGHHTGPDVHESPFEATLLFVPGALLRNEINNVPADWDEVTENGQINPDAYYRLYTRRLLPAFRYADSAAGLANKRAFITIPGLGCGQFAGKFQGQLGSLFKETLHRLLQHHGSTFSNIAGVYYDPYQECGNERHQIAGISFLVRPLTQGNTAKPQLCRPVHYAEAGDDFSDCRLFSVVAWDHVSWPGNDFYAGSRATDDGVKAAATSTMAVMTGVDGHYDPDQNRYNPPAEYSNWEDVILRHKIQLEITKL